MNYSSAKSGFLINALLAALLLPSAPQAASAQDTLQSFVRLFRLDGSFSTELPAKIDSDSKLENETFTLRSARLEADSMGFLTRLRSVLTIANSDASRRITEVEWRLDVYDEVLRSLSRRVLQAERVNIYPGETATASSKFGAVLPDRMIVLLQLVRVQFDDGSKWVLPIQCALSKELKTVICKAR